MKMTKTTQTKAFAKPAWVKDPNCVMTVGTVTNEGTRLSFNTTQKHLEDNFEKAKSVYRNMVKGGSGDEQMLHIQCIWSQLLEKHVEVDCSFGLKKVKNDIDKARQAAGKAYIPLDLAEILESENKLTTTTWVAHTWSCIEFKLCEDGSNSLWLTPAETVLACAELVAGKTPDILQSMLGSIKKFIPDSMKSNIELEKKLQSLKEKVEPSTDDVMRFTDNKVSDDSTKFAILMSYKTGGLATMHQHLMALSNQLDIQIPTEFDKFKQLLKSK
jgi:hypothetical protein